MRKLLLFLTFVLPFASGAFGQPAQPSNLPTNSTPSDYSLLFYIWIGITSVLVLISWILVKKEKCVIFYGRKDQLNSFYTFTLPVLLYCCLWFILGFFKGASPALRTYLPGVVAAGIFLWGMYALIKNAIVCNLDNKWFIPFVIFMKIYIGLVVGLAFALSVFSWSYNLRYANQNTRSWIWIIRWLSVAVGLVFMFIAHILTTYPEEEAEAGAFILPFGRTPSGLRM